MDFNGLNKLPQKFKYELLTHKQKERCKKHDFMRNFKTKTDCNKI